MGIAYTLKSKLFITVQTHACDNSNIINILLYLGY